MNLFGATPCPRRKERRVRVGVDRHVRASGRIRHRHCDQRRSRHVGATGELGYATGLQMISGMLKHGQKSGVWVRFTSLYRKVNGKWLNFHDHVSIPVDIQYGKALLDLKP